MTDFSSIDERLREIQSRLVRVTAEPAGSPPPAAPQAVTYEQRPAAPPPPPPPPGTPAESHPAQPAPEQYTPAPGAAPYSAPATGAAPSYGTAVQTPPPSTQQLAERAVIEPAEARAAAIVAAAEAEVAAMLEDGRRQVAELRQQAEDLKRQIDELIALRDRLDRPAARTRGSRQPATAAEPAPRLDPNRFGGTPGIVSLVVGPFGDVASIEEFDRGLNSIVGVDDVYLRAYESGRAIFELTVRTPVPLLDEIQRQSRRTLQVVDESAAALVATLTDAGNPGGAQ